MNQLKQTATPSRTIKIPLAFSVIEVKINKFAKMSGPLGRVLCDDNRIIDGISNKLENEIESKASQGKLCC